MSVTQDYKVAKVIDRNGKTVRGPMEFARSSDEQIRCYCMNLVGKHGYAAGLRVVIETAAA